MNITINGKDYKVTEANVKAAVDAGFITLVTGDINLGDMFFLESKNSDYLVGRVLVSGTTKGDSGNYGWVAMSLTTGKALVDPVIFTPKTKVTLTVDEFKKLLGKRASEIDSVMDTMVTNE